MPNFLTGSCQPERCTAQIFVAETATIFALTKSNQNYSELALTKDAVLQWSQCRMMYDSLRVLGSCTTRFIAKTCKNTQKNFTRGATQNGPRRQSPVPFAVQLQHFTQKSKRDCSCSQRSETEWIDPNKMALGLLSASGPILSAVGSRLVQFDMMKLVAYSRAINIGRLLPR